MKIELKHLAPYLPYGLKILPNNYRSISGGFGYHHKELDVDVLSRCNIEDIKPILKPLSDLIPETRDEYNVVDGIEDSVLINIIENLPQHCDAYDEWMDIYFDNPEPERIMQAPYELLQYLFENHFDVFGLIEAGLAIDINTLKNG